MILTCETRDKDEATRKILQMTVDGRRQKTLACHDSRRHTTKFRGGLKGEKVKCICDQNDAHIIKDDCR